MLPRVRVSVSRSLIVVALAVGCKKPQVEIEEEGPPAPLSPAEMDRLGQGPGGANGGPGDPNGGPAGPNGGPEGGPIGPAGEPGADPGGFAPHADLDNAGACALVDAYLTAQGRSVVDRQCFGLRAEGAGFRLPTYNLPATPAPTLIWDALPVCLWELEPGQGTPSTGAPKPGDGYEVAYFDTGSPCRSRDEYCRMGAPGMRLDLSRSACPGDDALGPPPAGALAAMVGKWQAASDREGPSTLEITADGQVTYKDGPLATAGPLRLVRPGNGVVDSAEGGVAVGFALSTSGPERLYFAPGTAAITRSPDAFVAEVLPARWVRRYRGACYDITPPADPSAPITEPRMVACAADAAAQTTVSMALDSGTVAMIHTPAGWLSAQVAGSVWRRAD